MDIPQDIQDIHKILSLAGKQLFVVGGCVRDHIIGQSIKDYDMATDAMPDEITALLSDKYRLDYTGVSFGVIRVYTDECPKGYEIATFREDISIGRQPDVRLGATIEEDVKRRDFTINALFYDLDKCSIIDLVGGLDDIKYGNIRCVGNPNDRFNEDKLRVLRAVRFVMRLDFYMDDQTYEAIHTCSNLDGLDKNGQIVSMVRERINEELFKAFEQVPESIEYIKYLQDVRMLSHVLPGSTIPNIWIESNSPEVIIASLYYSESNINIKFVNDIKRNLTDLKFPNKLINSVGLLLSASALIYNDDNDFEFVYSIARERDRTPDISDNDMSVFLHWVLDISMSKRHMLVDALVAYKLSVTGQELIEEGIEEGRVIGREIKKREQIKFEKLLQLYQ